MRRYNPKEIEPKWQKTWEQSKIYQASEDKSKPKRYVLEYFPYPSGAAMHVGHVRNYTIGDVVARWRRMSGDNVLHPMGWDAFGLPAENYAIKNHVSPSEAVKQNTVKFKKQLMQMGFSYDWSREINSTDPNYYKWTQWFFLLLFKKDLAYQKEALVNWDPVDKTVLANEQVIDGRADRSGAIVEKKALKQWFFKITEYADRLEKDLDDVNWTESIKTQQRNWIGRSVGAEIDFKVDGRNEKIKVFTTRPDTLFGATFMVLAPEHTLVVKLTTADQKKGVDKYVKAAEAKSDIQRQETDREKTGVFTGAYAINPVNDEKIPIWVADYVLFGYGTGAIMAVPAHDERDWEFAKKFNLPITQVVAQLMSGQDSMETRKDEKTVERNVAQCIIWHPTDNKIIVLEVPKYKWHTLVMGGIDDGEDWIKGAQREIYEETGYKNAEFKGFAGQELWSEFWAPHKNENRIAHFRGLEFKLKDLEQDPVDADEANMHNIHWVEPEKALLQLSWPEPKFFLQSALQTTGSTLFSDEGRLVNSSHFTGLSSSDAREKIVAYLVKKGVAKEKVNYKIRDWLISRQRYWGAPIPIIHCAKCGIVPVPEKDLPVLLPPIKSYEPSGDGRSPLANVPEFVNTTCPKCGGKAERETDTMDGFACSSWYFLRFADPHNNKEAFAKDKAEFWLPVDDYIGGAEHAVMHLLYARFWTKVMYDEGLVGFQEPFTTLRNQGMILAPDGQKMSKSKGNTIEPDGLIEQGYGADSIRIMELFIGPWNQSAAWSVEGMGGSFRFLQRAWTLAHEFMDSKESSNKKEANNIKVLRHRTIAKVSEDLEKLDFNTAISALMEYVNALYKLKAEDNFGAHDEWQLAIKDLVLLIAPFAPHIAEELWHELGNKDSVHTSSWPVHDPKYLVSDTVTIVVQVNGKLRTNLKLPTGSSEDQIVEAAKSDPKAAIYIKGKEIRKTIYVPGKLVNFVV